jgi:N-carbamoylputrescine amidase
MRLALLQITNERCDGAQGRERSVAAAARAFEDGADLVVMPELIVGGYVLDRDHQQRVAEPVEGPTVEAWTELASRHGGHLIGGFAERVENRVFNAAVLVGPDGPLLHYRKLHLFRGEREIFTPGDRGLPVISSPIGRIGLCVCYDLRFVETMRILALEGAQLVCVPTAWVPGFDSTLWDESGMAPQARAALVQANLNQVFVACASQVGAVGGLQLLGSSIVGGPDGTCLTGPMPGDQEATGIVELELSAADASQVRASDIRPRDERRRDVYGLVVGDRRL